MLNAFNHLERKVGSRARVADARARTHTHAPSHLLFRLSVKHTLNIMSCCCSVLVLIHFALICSALIWSNTVKPIFTHSQPGSSSSSRFPLQHRTTMRKMMPIHCDPLAAAPSLPLSPAGRQELGHWDQQKSAETDWSLGSSGRAVAVGEEEVERGPWRDGGKPSVLLS